jgi:hypothetical protein
MTATADEPMTDEFDLDIRLDELNPTDSDQSYPAMTWNISCTICCPSVWCGAHQTDDNCTTVACTGNACQN